MPPKAVKTVRPLVYREYAKLIYDAHEADADGELDALDLAAVLRG